MLSTSRVLLQRAVDFAMPQNCRKALRIAAAKQHATVLDTLDLLQCNADKLTCALKEDRRETARGPKHDTTKPTLHASRAN